MRRRKRRALVIGACALGFYLLHFGWFVLFGPPDWFQAVRQRAPEISSVALGSAFDGYLEEFDRPREASLGTAGVFEHSGVMGQVVREDRLAEGTALRQTRDESRDHLYALLEGEEAWRELPLPSFERLGEARLLVTGDRRRIVLTGLNSWWPFGENYGRFWRALFRPKLRPEVGLYLTDAQGVEGSYLFPGRQPVPSPDRGTIAFLRSERRGFHSIHVWRPGDAQPRTVVSLWEADPGSGASFRFGWSSDSKVLFVRGLARGSRGRPAGESGEIRLLYEVEGDRLVDLRR